MKRLAFLFFCLVLVVIRCCLRNICGCNHLISIKFLQKSKMRFTLFLTQKNISIWTKFALFSCLLSENKLIPATVIDIVLEVLDLTKFLVCNTVNVMVCTPPHVPVFWNSYIFLRALLCSTIPLPLGPICGFGWLAINFIVKQCSILWQGVGVTLTMEHVICCCHVPLLLSCQWLSYFNEFSDNLIEWRTLLRIEWPTNLDQLNQWHECSTCDFQRILLFGELFAPPHTLRFIMEWNDRSQSFDNTCQNVKVCQVEIFRIFKTWFKE